ncbi:unnamed protein product, partial [Medioppia subpectinata]
MSKNFGALSCEPCKAFFRRNALKNKFKCRLGNNCSIDTITRRFCSKCRLDKCLAIGMRREFIASDEKKELKRVSKLPNNNTTTLDTDFLSEILDDNNFSVDALNEQIVDIETSIRANDRINSQTNHISTDNQQNSDNYTQNSLTHYYSPESIDKKVVSGYEMPVIPIARPIGDHKIVFNETEIYIISELIQSTQFGSIMGTNSVFKINDNHGFNFILTERFDNYVRNETKAVKGLTAFNTICEDDRILLLKYSCIEVTFLRSILYLNDTADYLQLQGMYPILLFNPDHCNLVHRAVVKLQQHIYMHLLQRYLLLKYRSESEAKTRFLQFMNILTELNVMRDIQRTHTLNHSLNISPLLQEVLSSGVVVKTTSGAVKGQTIRAFDTSIDQFLGIPYAEPPVGKLRFAKPEPIKAPTPEEIDGTQTGNACLQKKNNFLKDYFGNLSMSEDCLTLNVWTAQGLGVGSALKPVMFWIHGGWFQYGSSFQHTPDYFWFNGTYLAANDVVFVSINYRLGLFGFTYGADETAPGNVAFLDQVLALKWVRENIHQFGGDRDQITIFGHSAGSWSVSAHILSPLSKCLFKRAIMQSGADIMNKNRGLITRPEALSLAKSVAKNLNCSSDEDKWLECLKAVDAERLKSETPTTLAAIELHDVNATKMTEFYLRDVDADNSDELKTAFYELYTDVSMRCPTYLFARQYAQHSPDSRVYFYDFSYQSLNAYRWGCVGPQMGVCHGAEEEFMFGVPLMYPKTFTPLDAQFARTVTKMWIDFAKTGFVTFGNPDKKWPTIISPGSPVSMFKDLSPYVPQRINFCALTCQSCKAFFRRNAFKLTIYRCRFDDNCHINETTRKLCKKCRLKKCFAVGMKKEWILNEEEKQIRLSQIEENKKLKQNNHKKSPNNTTFTTGSIGDNTIDNEINEYIMKIDDNLIASDECDEIIHEIFDNELDESENSNLTSDQMSVVSRESNTPSNCSTITIDDTLPHIKTYDKLKNNCMAIEILNCNSMDKLNNLCSFNPFECKLIAELFNQRLLAIHPVSDRRAGRFTTVDELMVYIATNFESYLQSFVDKSKGLRAFTTQCLNDQIAMVKYCCIESQLLKSVVFYSPHLEGWAFQKSQDFIQDNNTSVVLSLDLLK